MPKMQRQRPLATVAGEVDARFHRRELGQATGRIAFQRFNLDHLGPAFGQQLRGERHGHELSELDDPNTIKRLGIGLLIGPITGHLTLPFINLQATHVLRVRR